MVSKIHLYFLKTFPPKIIVPCKQKIVNYKFLYQLLKSLIIDDFMMVNSTIKNVRTTPRPQIILYDF